jgi:hypothetical protein
LIDEEIDPGNGEGVGLKNFIEEGWLGRLKSELRRVSWSEEVEEGQEGNVRSVCMVGKGKWKNRERATGDRRCKRSRSVVLTLIGVFRRLSSNVDNCE